MVAHLGNGASLCALNNGASIATTMGFSALDGLPMGTRCGAIDAGVVFYMLREMKLSPEEAERFLYTKCGLLGVSGHLERHAQAAIARGDGSRCQSRRSTCSSTASDGRSDRSSPRLGGIDALVFTGGIGENDAATRAEVLRGAAWAGFELDEAANATGGPADLRAGPARPPGSFRPTRN